MSNCNCCGCTVVDVLHRYVYGGSRYTFAAVQQLLASGGTLVDCTAVAHPTTVTTSNAWAVSAYGVGWNSSFYGTASGGQSSLDLGASMVQVDAAWSPLAGRSHAYIYDAESPPTTAEKTAAVSVSLLGSVTATATAQLIERDLPADFADPWQIYFDPDDLPSYSFIVFSSSMEPIRRPQYGDVGIAGYGTGNYIRSPYRVEVQASVVQCLPYNGPDGPYSGDFEPVLTQAFYDLPEPEGSVGTNTGPRAIPAHPGTPLGDFIERTMTGLESTLVYAEYLGLQRLGNDNDQAWSVHATREEADPPNTQGFQAKMRLDFQGQTRLIVGGPVWSQFSAATAINTSIRCLSLGDPEDIPANGLCTAYVDRGGAAIPSSYHGQNQQKTLHTYYRDGVQVLSAVNPTQQEIATATKADGSYLAVYQQTADPWTGEGLDSRRWNPGFHKTFGSFIRDAKRPVVGFTVPNDVFWGGSGPKGRVVSTEPLSQAFYNGRVYTCEADERTNGFYARPAFPWFFANSANGSFINAAGNYVLSPRAINGAATVDPAGLTDDVGNTPAHVPTVPWQAHVVPADNHRGATATLTDVGLQTCEYYRARSQQEKVASVTLSFDRKIDPESVDVSQFTLTRWNEDGTSAAVSGIQIEPVDDGSRKWSVTIPTAGQAERTFWILEYDPAGDVFTDDVVTIELRSIDQLPEQGQPKTIYVYPDPDDPEQLAYSYWGRPLGVNTGTIGYFDLAEGEPPVDYFGFPYDPEPCVLAARVSWLMADESGWPRLIDTSYTAGSHGIGRVVSLSKQVAMGKAALEEPAKQITTISADDNIAIPVTLGTYAPKLIRDGYVPSVPTVSSPTLRHSYFGLTTTIDPCTPATVSACSAPSVAQKHASAIRCDNDITGFEVELIAYEGNSPADMSKVDYGNAGDFSVLANTASPSDLSPGTTAAVLILAKDAGPITFGTTLGDETLPQNVWMAVEESRDTELPLKPAVSRPPDVTCTTGDYPGEWYRVRYFFENKEYSQSEVLQWPPILAGLNIMRDGVEINPLGPPAVDIELLPGDTYGPGNPPSMIGDIVPWWIYRRPPEVWPDDWSPKRHEDSGIVRQLVGGQVTQAGLQACLSASRDHRTYAALKTTTLGDLVLSLSMRVTLKAEVDYTDWQLEPILFGAPDGSYACGNLANYDDDGMLWGVYGWNTAGFSENTGAARGFTAPGPIGAEVDPGAYTRVSPVALNGWQKLEDATEANSRTVTHQFAADINDVLVLNKEQEERLASGEDVMVPAMLQIPDAQGRSYFWRIRTA